MSPSVLGMPPALALALFHLKKSRFFACRSCYIMYGLERLESHRTFKVESHSCSLPATAWIGLVGARRQRAQKNGQYACRSLLEVDPHIMETVSAHVWHVRARCQLRQTLGSPLERARRRGRLHLSGSSRWRSRAARLAQRWQTRRALTFRTRSKQVGRAAASGRREGWFGSPCSRAPAPGQ